MTRTIRGIRDSIPGGTLVGRAKSGSGPAEPVDLSAVAAAIAALQRGKAALNSTGAILKANPVQLDFVPPGGTTGQILTKASGTDFDAHWVSGGSGTGDVVGPASAVTNHVAFFDGTTGKLIKDSGVTLSGSNTGDQTLSDATLSTSDITTNNVSITKHGFAPKAPNDATKYLDGTGAWSTPAGGGGGGGPREGTVQLPLSGSFTWINQGDATATDGTAAFILSAPANASASWRIQQQATPSVPFNIYMRVESYIAQAASPQIGIVLRNSTSGRLLVWTWYGNSATTSDPNLAFARWTSATAFSANLINRGVVTPPKWLRVNVTSTTVTVYHGFNGLDWVQEATTELLATFLNASGGTLDNIGFGAQVQNAAAVHFVSSWGTTTPT